MYSPTGFFAGKVVLAISVTHVLELAEKIELIAEFQTRVVLLCGRLVAFQTTAVGDPG
ncbi:Uncharacterised protein [Escherichia coli]|nr:Uncharacterised protein [Escherichia coli]VVZ81995.1 Uncharacterised protein [Escherichia coli]